MIYYPDRKTFLPQTTPPVLHGDALSKITMLRDRVSILFQRTLRSEFFQPQIAGQVADVNHFVVSVFIERLYGHTAANVVTIMILWVALASLFAVLLGYSRVPYAAATQGSFFKIFAKLHPKKNFPYISLLVISSIAFVFSLLFKMAEVISGILAMRIIVQFIGQAIGLMLLRKRNDASSFPFKMPLYPLPVILAILMWLFIFYATGLAVISMFFIVAGSGVVVYFLKKRFEKQV